MNNDLTINNYLIPGIDNNYVPRKPDSSNVYYVYPDPVNKIDFKDLLDSGDILQFKSFYSQIFYKKNGVIIASSNTDWFPIDNDAENKFKDKNHYKFLLRVYRPLSNMSMNMNHFFKQSTCRSNHYKIIYENI